MDLKSKVLFVGVVFFTILSLSFTLYKTFFLHDFEIVNTEVNIFGEDY